MDFFEEAKKRLDEGRKMSMGQRGNAMKGAVADALEEFCRQDAEFAQAVAQGGSFAECMKAVEKEIHGGAISDMEAFGAAVKFYFPGAGIRVTMRIDLCAEVDDEEPAPGVVVDLSDFF